MAVFLLLLLAAAPDAAAPAGPAKAPAAVPQVEVVRKDADKRVDVLFDGQPFTSYRFTDDVKKPVLYPLRTAGGAIITRGWPLEPRPDEATDHRHHVGYWLNYGEVNGADFWGNSTGGRNKGTVVQRKVERTRGGPGQGELAVAADWVMPDGAVALREATSFGFSGAAGRRVVDRFTTLTAAGSPVSLPDTKEGMLGLRVARTLEHPSSKNPGGTGRYRSSEGLEGEAVWGTRGRWVMLTGMVEKTGGGSEPVTLAMLDHPKNPGFPSYWHARPWGLFAANPLGQKVFSKGKLTMNFALAKQQAARFQYRLLILSRIARPEEIEAEYQRWVKP